MESTISRRVTRSAGGPPRGGWLRVVYPVLGAPVEVGLKRFEIGRDPGSGGLRIEDATVSRRHLSVAWEDEREGHVVRDLGSHNGAALNGEALDEHPRPLADNSVLRAGDALLVYEKAAAIPADASDVMVSPDAVPGDAAGVRLLKAQLARAAPDPSPILLVGESGTGKEWIAREAHRLSGRSGPLVAINCATLSAQLVESQLFGHARGAFTGATEAQPGFFRAAEGGTLFLDEIGELALELQPKLLRALQEREIQPLGASRTLPVNVRVVAATHRPLALAVETGSFRRDLYARLSLWELSVPALRERRADLCLWFDRLAKAFLAERSLPGVLTLESDAAEALLLAWLPGNLRDVDRLVHHLGPQAAPVAPWQLPEWLHRRPGPEPEGSQEPAPDRRAVPSRTEIEDAWREHHGSVHALARVFQRDRRQIYRWVTQYRLKKA